ncbi:MAG: hypothetical protein RQ714_06535 [Nitrosomonas sp.]|nr:hypothetical protein [Nitrosomonas sp.]
MNILAVLAGALHWESVFYHSLFCIFYRREKIQVSDFEVQKYGLTNGKSVFVLYQYVINQ